MTIRVPKSNVVPGPRPAPPPPLFLAMAAADMDRHGRLFEPEPTPAQVGADLKDLKRG